MTITTGYGTTRTYTITEKQFEGSEKQISWAKDLANKTAVELVNKLDGRKPVAEVELWVNALITAAPSDAKWWIDNRDNYRLTHFQPYMAEAAKAAGVA